jgi:hypothetical protein
MSPTESQLRAASEMGAVLSRLGIEPGHTTPAELAAEDAIFEPSTVDRPKIEWADGGEKSGTEGGL